MVNEGENRRKAVRVSSTARCWCETDNITVYAQLANVSEGGLFLRSLAPLSKGTRTRVRFVVAPSAPEIEAEAVVVWRREHTSDGPPGMGLMFTQVPQPHLDRIRAFIGVALDPDRD